MIALLIKASIVIAILLVFYKVFLEKESFFGANRIYLLTSLALTFILPFIYLPHLVEEQGLIDTMIEEQTIDHKRETPLPHLADLQTGTSATIKEQNNHIETPVPNLEINSSDNKSTPTSTTILEQDINAADQNEEQRETGLLFWLMMIYYFGLIIFSLNFIVQVGSVLFKVIKNTDKISDINGIIINSSAVTEPCSFFNYIFINPESYDYDTYEQILAHEKIHVRKCHTLDLLLSEIVVIILWFNPLIWLFRKEVEKNIEYQTDDLLLNGEKVEKENYQMNLLRIATFKRPLTITTNYNQSLIKQRILKMSAKKSNLHSYWKYTFVAPLLFVLLLLLNKPNTIFAQSELPIAPLVGNKEKVDAAGDMRDSKEDQNDIEKNITSSLDIEIDEKEVQPPSDSEVDVEDETDVKSDCERLLKAAMDGDEKKVRKLLTTFDPDCMPFANRKDYSNLDYVRFLVANDGEVLINNNAAQIIIEGTVINLENHDYDFHEGFGNRIKSDCKELNKAIKDKDVYKIKKLLMALDKDCIVNSDDQEELEDLELTKKILINGGEISLGTRRVIINFDELARGENGVNEYERTSNENTLLNALKTGDLTSIKYLLSQGAEINKVVAHVGTPLLVAAQYGDLEAVKYLLSQGAKIDKTAAHVGTPLLAASRNGHLEIIKYLLSQGADIKKEVALVGTPLLVASGVGRMEVVKYLLSQGADINKEVALVGTPLLVAAREGRMEVVKYLLSQGARS